jgi:hypothetical protein
VGTWSRRGSVGPVKTPHWSPAVALPNVSSVPCIGNSAMVYPPVSPTWRSPPLRPIVLLLHATSQAAVACELVRVWQSSIPVADIFTVSVVEEGRTDFANLPAALVDGSGACKRAFILVGVCAAENMALRLGFDRRLPQCAGVLVAGRVMPPLGPLVVQMPDQVGRQRLIWEVSDATNWAVALGVNCSPGTEQRVWMRKVASLSPLTTHKLTHVASRRRWSVWAASHSDGRAAVAAVPAGRPSGATGGRRGQ